MAIVFLVIDSSLLTTSGKLMIRLVPQQTNNNNFFHCPQLSNVFLTLDKANRFPSSCGKGENKKGD